MEHQVRQLLADKVSGNQVGIWLLLPELQRLGVWDLLCAWTGQPGEHVEPRLALHLINESALCLCSMRRRRSLSQKGFELANGLPFVPTDAAVHQLLAARTVPQTQQLQVALGKLRRAGQHFHGGLLAIDPHRLVSYSKRQMRRHRFSTHERARKMAQTFFLLDAQTQQPVCFTLASSATTATQAAQQLLDLTAQILDLPAHPQPKPLVLADKEHCSHELFAAVVRQGRFDLLVAMPARPRSAAARSVLHGLPFTEQWAGFATVQRPFHFHGHAELPLVEFIQRSGARPADYLFEAFLSTASRPELPTLTEDYPERWHIEEFFKQHQALGWDRAGTLNLNVRYAHMTMALIAQAALHQLRQRLGPPVRDWDAPHLADQFFFGWEGDVRVAHDTIVITLYNAPNVELLRQHYDRLPEKLHQAGVETKIPWLYDFKLDFRFR